MKVLAVSDEVNSLLYSPFAAQIAGNVDVIVSCGDLPAYYLDYLVSVLGKPLLYVCGNHDVYGLSRKTGPEFQANSYSDAGFDYNHRDYFGGRNLDMKTEKVHGAIFGGLEGSYRYNRGDHQYTDRQMASRIRRFIPRLMWNRLTEGRSIDVLVTHAPPYSLHDRDDLPHRGFESYLKFIRHYKPRYLLHGHTHLYDRNESRIIEYNGTTVINCFNYQVLDLDLENRGRA